MIFFIVYDMNSYGYGIKRICQKVERESREEFLKDFVNWKKIHLDMEEAPISCVRKVYKNLNVFNSTNYHHPEWPYKKK